MTTIESRNNVIETQTQPQSQQNISIAKILESITSNGTIDKQDDPNLKLLLDRYNEATQEHKDFLRKNLGETLNKGFSISGEANYNNIKGLLEKNGLTNGKNLPSFQDVMKLNNNNPYFVIKFKNGILSNDKIAFFNDKGEDFGDLDLKDGKFTKSYLIKNDDIKDNNTIQKYNLTPDEQRAENAKNQPSQSTQTPQNNENTNNQTQNNSPETTKNGKDYLKNLVGKKWREVHRDQEAIKIIQTMLGITVDGKVGPQTIANVINFQKNNGLTPDGLIGKQTLEKLTSDNPVIPNPVTN